MFKRKRAMTTEAASIKKRTGHINERVFAELIEGNVISGRGKTDVIDQEGNRYSVKGAEWWQIFMYTKSRFLENTEFIEMGNVADLLIDCLNAFPETRTEYVADRIVAKERLQPAMRGLKNELNKPGMFAAFLSKGIFNGNEVDYLAVIQKDLSSKDIDIGKKHFHVFSASDVVSVLSTKFVVANSTAFGHGQMSDLKVIFKYRDKNAGELEIRTDTSHYRKARWRLNSGETLRLLLTSFGNSVEVANQISVYGSAIHDLH